MYRDADDGLRERFEAIRRRAERQLEGLAASDLEELPEELRQRITSFEDDFAPEVFSPAALVAAERALDEREPLVREARAILRKQRRAERRRRRDEALRRGLHQRIRRCVWASLLALAAIAVPAYLLMRARAKESCARSAVCRVRGDCSIDDWLSCRPGSDEDCRQSSDCREHGMCSRDGDMCSRTRPEDCQYMDRCQPPNECTFEDGLCVRVTNPVW